MKPSYGYPRKLGVLIAAVTPTNWMRVSLYRLLYGDGVSRSARIGFGTVIAVDSARIGGAAIGRFNRFQGPLALEIADGAKMGDRNQVDCGEWILSDRPEGSRGSCTLGANALVTGNHYIDVTSGFSLGARSWIAGRETQVWTHGSGVPDGKVEIGSDSYVGSAARFAPGSGVGDCCVVGLGAVVTKKFSGTRQLIAGVPAVVVRENIDWPRTP